MEKERAQTRCCPAPEAAFRPPKDNNLCTIPLHLATSNTNSVTLIWTPRPSEVLEVAKTMGDVKTHDALFLGSVISHESCDRPTMRSRFMAFL